ncbi:hypothetical protein [Bacillus sp. FJAT-44742]|uniref:hypothetical protein n=1 Tax=Bacillus sp. FJAT-44742 TaxID=2014005 RepID=UPI000C242627|nr:hypothetical protein [Bacillus sp. FJAT-44742]
MTHVITAFFSAFIYSAGFALAGSEPASRQVDEVYYFSFQELLLFSLVYAFPVYFIGGIPSAILLEKTVRKIRASQGASYVYRLLLYSAAGFVVMCAAVVIISGGHVLTFLTDLIGYGVFGAVGAVLYFHIYLAVTRVRRYFAQKKQ